MATQMQSSKPTGAGAAAVVAAGIGTFTIGLMTSLAEASTSLSNSLNWYSPSGPLSGKIGVGVVAWLVAWVILQAAWKNKNVNFGRAFSWSLALIFLGFLLTFPPVFSLFAR
jgi:hypothetical protein